jgi:hypothetical protein
MPYRKQKSRVLAGSLNLLPPGDIVPPPDSLALTNWRVDQAGALHSRKGMGQLATGLVDTVHSLFRLKTATGDDRYGGAGTALLYGTNLGTTMTLPSWPTRGLDGGPLSMVAYQDFVWLMNPGRQVKLFGSEVRNWGIAAPTTAPTVTAGSQETIPVATCNASEGLYLPPPGGDQFSYTTTEWQVVRWSAGEPCSTYTEVVDYDQGTVEATEGNINVYGTGVYWEPTLYDPSPDAGLIDIYGTNHAVKTKIAGFEGTDMLMLSTPYDDETASGLAYRIYHRFRPGSFDAANAVSGESLRIVCTPIGRWVATRRFPSPIDCRISAVPGGDLDDDRFRFWIWCEDAGAIDSLKVTLRSGDCSVTCSVPVSILSPAKYAWNQLSISRRFDPHATAEENPEYQALLQQMAAAEAAGDDVTWNALNQQLATLYNEILARTLHFVELIAPDGVAFNWGAVTELWFEVEVNNPTVIHFDKAEMVGGADNTFEGEWWFCYTYENEFGHESNPSGFSTPVQLRKQAPTVVMAASTDSQVVRCHVYGIGGVVTQPLRFGTKNSNGGDLTIDKIHNCKTVEEAQTDNIEVPDDHDPPPAGRGIAGPYFGRILAWAGNRLYWSKVAQPAYWPGADDDGEGNWVDVGQSGDDILAVTCHKRMAVIYKQRSIWRLTGDPAEADPEQTSANVGLLGERAIVNAGAVDYFAAAEGIYRFNGDFEEKISTPVDPIFKGDWVTIAGDALGVVKPISVQRASQAVMGFINGRLYFSYVEEGLWLPNTTLVYETDSRRWYRDSRGFSAINYEGQGQSFVAAVGTVGGAPYGANLYEIEQGTADAGVAIPVLWQSAFSDQGLPNNRKVYADLVVDFKSAQVLTVAMVYDNFAVEAAGTAQSTDRTTATFRLGTGGLGRRALNAAVRISGDVTSETVIYGVYLHWYAEARIGKTYDSGVSDDGTAQAKLYTEMEFHVEADGQVCWALHTDVPGGVMAQRDSGNFAATAGRKTVPVVFAANVFGCHRRLLVWSDQTFALHGIRLRVLPVGEYIDGAQGDTWESQPV